MADTQRSGRCGGNLMRVQLPPSALNIQGVEGSERRAHSEEKRSAMIMVRSGSERVADLNATIEA
jgi:hypothetical protein